MFNILNKDLIYLNVKVKANTIRENGQITKSLLMDINQVHE